MLDVNFIRENKKIVADNLKKRKASIDLENFLLLDNDRRELILEIEELRKQKNEISSKGSNAIDIEKAKEVKQKLNDLEPKLKNIEQELQKQLLLFPNISDPEVPEGESEAENKVIREWGSPRKFDFPIKDHAEIGRKLDIIDIERGVKISGSGFYYLKNEGALLEMALVNFAINKLRDKGFTFLITPDLVKERSMIGTGFFPTEENEVYKMDKDDLYLVGTSEVALVSYHSDEILEEGKLPLFYTGFSSCFRREAGSYGKDSKGLFRVHQFNKVEMVVLSKPEQSEEIHQKLVKISEEILQELKLPYQVVINCLGDLGAPNKKRYDINTWMPSWNNYRETHSASNDGDFQSRRLNIRYRNNKGEVIFCHTLNNTAVASPRLLVALIENYQNQDGSITVPEGLYPYVSFKEIRNHAEEEIKKISRKK
ncbi:MAG: serine--tRNA ligase [Candidatus Paceibacterota bacterium]|jgi:seryl-tRNA synthetase